jgi:ATP-dependent protease ClpP protease subunit
MRRGQGTVTVSIPKRIIRIEGTISLQTSQKVLRAIRDMQRHTLDPIVVVIGYSEGGCATVGCALYGMLRNSVAPIYTVAERLAWSAACYIFLAGQRRVMFNNARVGLHSTTITHYADTTRNLVGLYSDVLYVMSFDARLVHIVREATGLPKKKIHELLIANKPFDTKTALELRLATDTADGRLFYKSVQKHIPKPKIANKKCPP